MHLRRHILGVTWILIRQCRLCVLIMSLCQTNLIIPQYTLKSSIYCASVQWCMTNINIINLRHYYQTLCPNTCLELVRWRPFFSRLCYQISTFHIVHSWRYGYSVIKSTFKLYALWDVYGSICQGQDHIAPRYSRCPFPHTHMDVGI